MFNIKIRAHTTKKAALNTFPTCQSVKAARSRDGSSDPCCLPVRIILYRILKHNRLCPRTALDARTLSFRPLRPRVRIQNGDLHLTAHSRLGAQQTPSTPSTGPLPEQHRVSRNPWLKFQQPGAGSQSFMRSFIPSAGQHLPHVTLWCHRWAHNNSGSVT